MEPFSHFIYNSLSSTIWFWSWGGGWWKSMKNISCFIGKWNLSSRFHRSRLGSWLSPRKGRDAGDQRQLPAVLLTLPWMVMLLADGALIDVHCGVENVVSTEPRASFYSPCFWSDKKIFSVSQNTAADPLRLVQEWNSGRFRFPLLRSVTTGTERPPYLSVCSSVCLSISIHLFIWGSHP